MKIYLKFASIPLALFLLLFGIPRLIAILFNSHSDLGIVAILLIVCALFSAVAYKFYNALVKETTENER